MHMTNRYLYAHTNTYGISQNPTSTNGMIKSGTAMLGGVPQAPALCPKGPAPCNNPSSLILTGQTGSQPRSQVVQGSPFQFQNHPCQCHISFYTIRKIPELTLRPLQAAQKAGPVVERPECNSRRAPGDSFCRTSRATRPFGACSNSSPRPFVSLVPGFRKATAAQSIFRHSKPLDHS